MSAPTLHTLTDRIWTISDFLSPAECDQLIILSEQNGYAEAEVSLPQGAKMMKSVRDNDRLIYTDTALAARYWERLRPFCPEVLDGWQAVGLNEQFRFYRYENSQRFKRHIDGSFIRNPDERSFITFLIYLNDGFQGGETAFDMATVVPETGAALCFLHAQKHEGCPVTDGTKYVLRSDVMYRRG